MSTAANPQVDHYRFATPITGAAHESWTLVGTEDNSYELDLDTDYAIIIKVGNRGDMIANDDFQLQYNVAAAGWNDVNGTSSNFRSAASGDTDGATSATERLTTSARTFQTSTLDEVDGLDATNVTGGSDVEFYFTFNVRSAELSGNESIEFRLLTGGATFTHNVTLSATIAAQDTNVSANSDALTLTTYNATVDLGIDISASSDALTLTTYQASITYDVNVSANSDALTLAAYGATVGYDVDVSANLASLALTTYQAGVDLSVDISAASEALILTAQPATITYDVDVSASSDALTITAYSASVSFGVDILAGSSALTITPYAASIAYDINVSANSAALTLTAYQASFGNDVDVSASSVSLTLSSYSPSITFDRNILANSAALSLATYAATVDQTSDVVFEFPVQIKRRRRRVTVVHRDRKLRSG